MPVQECPSYFATAKKYIETSTVTPMGSRKAKNLMSRPLFRTFVLRHVRAKLSRGSLFNVGRGVARKLLRGEKQGVRGAEELQRGPGGKQNNGWNHVRKTP
jgi:hypothetical protein